MCETKRDNASLDAQGPSSTCREEFVSGSSVGCAHIPSNPNCCDRRQCAVGFIYAHDAGSWCTERLHGCCTRWQVIIHVDFTNLCYCVRAAFTWRHKSRAKGRQDASKGGLQCLGICVVACRATPANTVLFWASTFPRPNVHHATSR